MRSMVWILLIPVVLSALSCAGSKTGEGAEATLSGTIVAVGNDPFVDLALSTDASTTYRLEAEAGVMKELSRMQGRTVEIRGTVRRDVRGLILKIEKYVVQ